MNMIALIIGVLWPTLNGVLLLRFLEGKTIVLARGERIAMGCVMGLTLLMFGVFVLHAYATLKLTLLTFVLVHTICSGILFFLCHQSHTLSSLFSGVSFPREPLKDLVIGCFLVLLLWVGVKTLVTATSFLVLSPTYFDDSLDAWNMRGKLYYTDQQMTLVLPGDNPLTSPQGVSSYPPTVPLIKTWLADLAGQWSDPLVNSVQVVWYVAALVLVFYAIRRHAGLFWALSGTYILGSMPLYLMHGTNAYADCFLSVHVFLAISLLFHAMHAPSPDARMSFFRIGAVAAALLPFTKNEGMLVFLPPLLLLLVVSVLTLERSEKTTRRETVQTLLWYSIALLCVAGPWLLFKWSHGLSFGNGKPFTSLSIGWQPFVLQAIFINTLFEGNWLLLFPLLFVLLLWKWRAAGTSLVLLTAFFLMIYLGQAMLYLFTSLSTEALRQTGYARGLVQLMPTIVLLTTLLLSNAFPHLPIALAKRDEMRSN